MNKSLQRAIDLLATFISIGVMLAAGMILWEDGPLSSALWLFVAGLVLLPYIPIRYGGVRALVFIFGIGLAIGLPAMDFTETHKQSRAAVDFALDAAGALMRTSLHDGRWPTDLRQGLPGSLDVPGGDYALDLMIADCRGQACDLVVTFTDGRHKPRLKDHSFVLWTDDGGKTWTCGPGGAHPAPAADLPPDCREVYTHMKATD